jgi:predicted O-methyltransferase YrrM
MTQSTEGERIADRLLDVYGGDPYREVYDACEPHREAHGTGCGVYPAEAPKMRVLATLVRAVGARSALEIGGGLGYSALWLAEALPADGRLETIDLSAEHVRLIERYAGQFGLGERITAIEGEGSEVLGRLGGPYDVIHDDGWVWRTAILL